MLPVGLCPPYNIASGCGVRSSSFQRLSRTSYRSYENGSTPLLLYPHNAHSEPRAVKTIMALKQFPGTFVPDNSEGEHGYEAFLDFEMSWVLRVCANQEEARLRPNLYHQCRMILNKLTRIGIDKCVDEVKVWKQWKYIDILAEIKVKDEGLHVLVLEDKAYTEMTPKQKEEYPKEVFEYYKEKSGIEYHFCVISFLDPDYDSAKYVEFKNGIEKTPFGPGKKCNWEVFSTLDLPDWKVNNYTESDLFNEFWFAKW